MRKRDRISGAIFLVIVVILFGIVLALCNYSVQLNRCIQSCVAASGLCAPAPQPNTLHDEACRRAWRECVTRCRTDR